MLNLVEHLWFLLTCKLLVGIVVFMRICRATGSKSMCFWTSCKKALLFRSISPTVTSPGQIKHDRVNVTIPMSVFMFSGRSDELDVKKKKKHQQNKACFTHSCISKVQWTKSCREIQMKVLRSRYLLHLEMWSWCWANWGCWCQRQNFDSAERTYYHTHGHIDTFLLLMKYPFNSICSNYR